METFDGRVEARKMNADFDVIVVGSGPAGVSAAFPMVEAGLRVLLVDGGRDGLIAPPTGAYLTNRSADESQWTWMVGKDFQALQNDDAASPKLRVPGHGYVFDDFSRANRIAPHDYVAVGSLARGGLSNAWGCGVARLSADEMATFPFPSSDMDASWQAVALRMGLSGGCDDDLSDYFGLDCWAGPPIQLDDVHGRVLERYRKRRGSLAPLGFRLGRSRVAVLGADRGARKGCDLSGNCLWGCHRRALYSATEDLELLRRHRNFSYLPGFVVESLGGTAQARAVLGRDAQGPRSLSCQRVVLAAGTLATTRLALQAAGLDRPVPMQSCPTAAFMLWLPAALGRSHSASFGLGQLSFVVSLQAGLSGFGSLFSPTGIPVAEFSRHMPFGKRYGIDVLASLLSSCMIGNIFLPGHLTAGRLSLAPDGALRVEGRYTDEVPGLMQQAQDKLRKVFRKLGAVVLPRSFTIGRPGSDIHYAASLPMRADPQYGETNAMGELAGLDGMHIVDGASLPLLTEKSHTLTIMANADRVGRRIAARLAAQR